MKTTCPKCNGTAETSLHNDMVKDKQDFAFFCRCGNSFNAVLSVGQRAVDWAQSFVPSYQGESTESFVPSNQGESTEILTDC
jgi:transcription elongation factor Elf1